MIVGIQKVLAFTNRPNSGNPAGVVLRSPELSDDQMKDISRRLQVSETAFVLPSSKADYTVRFFSPTTEVDLCGHATIATFYALGASLSASFSETVVLHQETKVGVLPVDLHFRDGMIDHVMMTQQKAVFEQVQMHRRVLSETLGIDEQEVMMDCSSHRVSTGLFTLPVCVSSLDVLKGIKPDGSKIRSLCESIGVGSLHVFTFETFDPASLYHARNFAPIYGVLEDPVTGTANGAVASYLYHRGVFKENLVMCEQGDIIGRPGRVAIDLSGPLVKVGGKAHIAEIVNIEV
jgi:PhzF family phenazine biosynthesis protein